MGASPESRERRSLWWRAAFITLLSSFVGCVATLEIIFRMVDGYSLTRISLPASAPSSEPASARGLATSEVAALVDGLAVAPGVDRSWYFESPLPISRPPVDPEMQALYEQIRDRMPAAFDMFKLWNTNFVRQEACRDESGGHFHDFPGFAFAFEPVEPGPYPRYRFLPSTTTPLGLVTNGFGWRGREIERLKAPGVIRVAFLGASTTAELHAEPFAYPDYVGHWLNRWAQAHHPGVRIEILNTGREGFGSTDIAAVMRQELGPVGPDIVLYYEGSNQFSLQGLARGVRGDRSSPASSLRESLGLPPMSEYSALARRLHALRLALVPPSGVEPGKPSYSLSLPDGLDELEPELDAVHLPLDLQTILRDLESIRRDSQDVNASLVMTSFVWMVWDGMILDPRRQPSFSSYFAYLNSSMAPFRYEDIRRMADLQNRVFRRYAQAARIPFIDVAGQLPREPRLFVDPIHNTPEGSRLRAWIIFQGLVPIIESRVLQAEATPERLTSPAVLPVPEKLAARRLELAAVRRSCAVPPTRGPVSPASSFNPRRRIRLEDLAWHRESGAVHLEERRGGLLIRTDETAAGRQASTWIDSHGANEALLRITLRLRSGGVRLGVSEAGRPAERTLLFIRPRKQTAVLHVPLSGRGRLQLTWENARPRGGPSTFRILDLEIGLR